MIQSNNNKIIIIIIILLLPLWLLGRRPGRRAFALARPGVAPPLRSMSCPYTVTA